MLVQTLHTINVSRIFVLMSWIERFLLPVKATKVRPHILPTQLPILGIGVGMHRRSVGPESLWALRA